MNHLTFQIICDFKLLPRTTVKDFHRQAECYESNGTKKTDRRSLLCEALVIGGRGRPCAQFLCSDSDHHPSLPETEAKCSGEGSMLLW